MDEAEQRTMVRRSVVDQLSVDPMTGVANAIPSDTATLMAWGRRPGRADRDRGPAGPRAWPTSCTTCRSPTRSAATRRSPATCCGPSVLEIGANFFSKDPWAYNMGPGTTRVSFRPIPFDGTLTPSKVVSGSPSGATCRCPPGPGATQGDRPAASPGRRLRRARGRAARHRGARRGDGRRGSVRATCSRGSRYELKDPARFARSRVRRAPGPVRQRAPGPGGLPVPGPHRRGPSSDRHRPGRPASSSATTGRSPSPASTSTSTQGEIFGLVGPNGAGKTTTLRILATLLAPDAGDAEIAGASVRRNPDDVRRVLGFMPDAFGVYDDMKVWEYLDFFARCYGIPAARRRRMIGDLLELVDLGRQARRLRPEPVARHAAAAVPRPRARPRPAGAAPRRARVGPRPAGPRRAARAPARAPALGKTILDQQPHPPRARGAVHRGRDHRPRPGAGPGPGRRHRAAAPLRRRAARPGPRRRRGPRGRPRLVRGRARRRLGGRSSTTARSRSASAATTTASAELLAARGRRGAADRSASPGPRATSRSCSSRSPAGPTEPRSAARRSAGMTAGVAVRRAGRTPAAVRAACGRRRSSADVGGITAIGVKELRGRMRGRRAFVILTIHLLLLAGFAWMVELIIERTLASGFGGRRPSPPRRSAGALRRDRAHAETLMSLFLAPASTAGAISLEREKQTLDLLITTPISSLAIVARQAAVSAVVGPAAPARVDPGDGARVRVRRRRPGRRGQGLRRPARRRRSRFGSIGLFVSALVKRTQAATVINSSRSSRSPSGRCSSSCSGRR